MGKIMEIFSYPLQFIISFIQKLFILFKINYHPIKKHFIIYLFTFLQLDSYHTLQIIGFLVRNNFNRILFVQVKQSNEKLSNIFKHFHFLYF